MKQQSKERTLDSWGDGEEVQNSPKSWTTGTNRRLMDRLKISSGLEREEFQNETSQEA